MTWLPLLCRTGLSIPNVPNYVGAEHLQVYDSMSVDPDDYRGQSLLVVGNGNSAFETVRTTPLMLVDGACIAIDCCRRSLGERKRERQTLRVF